MTITRAFATTNDGYPILELRINGQPAFVLEPKLTLLEAGIVVLLDHTGYWETTLSETFEGDDGDAIQVAGATRDVRIVALVWRFVAGETGDLLTSPS